MGVPQVSLATAARTSLLLLLNLLPAPSQAANSIDDLTGPWQLFVDDYPILSKTNLVRTYHPFQKYTNNPVLVADQPWEGLVYLYGTVLPNESGTGYRMWYHTLRPSDTNNDGSLELYATSTDGIHWTKPILNLRSWHGSTANNMYFTRPTTGGMTSVMQTPWDPDPAKLYKLMSFDTGGYFGAWSADGIHITDAPDNPVFTGGSDVGQFCWDPHTQLFRGYVKNAWYDWNGLKRRAVALTTTTNVTSWPQESLILWPDAYDDRWVPAGTIQRTHFYGLSAFPYESMYIGFLWIFRATDVDGYYIGPCFVELISSRDGIHWVREEGTRPPLLPLGPDGAWDDGMVFTARAPVVEGDTIKIWYGGFDQVHGTSLTKTIGSIGLATLRKDGFASLDAGATPGNLLTKPLTGAGGSLQVNYRAVGGSLKAEVLDDNDNILSGYSQAECVALTGDGVSQLVTWTAHPELPSGMARLRLRFVLQNAALYSFAAGPSAALVDLPMITQQPSDKTIAPGGAADFAVAASALSPLGYQWQRNQVNLTSGGHYSGCSTPTLNILDADNNDAATYRCVITNAYGTIVSRAATLAVAWNAFGSVTLTNIPRLAGDLNNEARAITCDGRYVVGLSGTNNGFLFDSASNWVLRPVSADGAVAQIVVGAGCRTVTNGASPQTQLVLSGLAASNGRFTQWMTTNGGTTWGNMVQPAAGPKKPTVPLANGLAATASDIFYSIWTDEGTGPTDNWGLRVGQCSGPWPVTPVWNQKDVPKPDTCQVNGVSSNGRAVGWRKSGATGISANYIADWESGTSPSFWNSYGLDGTTAGLAYSVSADGTAVFGISPLVVGGVTNYYGYKAVFNATYPGPATQIATNPLPNFSDTAGTSVLAIPYGCSADGKYAVGMSYRGLEKAVLWNTSDAHPTNWTVMDLTETAVGSGATDIFARLSRAYSVATNAAGSLVIAGAGLDTNSPARTRGFLMTFSPPRPTVIPLTSVTISGPSGGGFTFTCPSVADARVMYYLEFTTNLNSVPNWNPIGSTPGTGGTVTLSDPNPSDRQRLYRIRMQ
jgi:hypothetical protein